MVREQLALGTMLDVDSGGWIHTELILADSAAFAAWDTLGRCILILTKGWRYGVDEIMINDRVLQSGLKSRDKPHVPFSQIRPLGQLNVLPPMSFSVDVAVGNSTPIRRHLTSKVKPIPSVSIP